MGIFRRQAHRLLAIPFLLDGIETLRDPAPRADELKSTVHRLSARYEWLPDNPELLVRAQAATGIAGGALLVTGKARRLACLLLAAQTVPTLIAEGSAIKRRAPHAERRVAVRDLSLLAALLLSATEPKRRPPRVVYDAEHAVRRVRRGSARVKAKAGKSRAELENRARKAAGSAAKAARRH